MKKFYQSLLLGLSLLFVFTSVEAASLISAAYNTGNGLNKEEFFMGNKKLAATLPNNIGAKVLKLNGDILYVAGADKNIYSCNVYNCNTFHDVGMTSLSQVIPMNISVISQLEVDNYNNVFATVMTNNQDGLSGHVFKCTRDSINGACTWRDISEDGLNLGFVLTLFKDNIGNINISASGMLGSNIYTYDSTESKWYTKCGPYSAKIVNTVPNAAFASIDNTKLYMAMQNGVLMQCTGTKATQGSWEEVSQVTVNNALVEVYNMLITSNGTLYAIVNNPASSLNSVASSSDGGISWHNIISTQNMESYFSITDLDDNIYLGSMIHVWQIQNGEILPTDFGPNGNSNYSNLLLAQ